mgnify:CR=1 FL=1
MHIEFNFSFHCFLISVYFLHVFSFTCSEMPFLLLFSYFSFLILCDNLSNFCLQFGANFSINCSLKLSLSFPIELSNFYFHLIFPPNQILCDLSFQNCGRESRKKSLIHIFSYLLTSMIFSP